MSYIDAALAPQRNTGQIKIHGPQAFAGMLKAGQLAAEALDMLTPYVVPGVTSKRLDDLAYQFACDHNAYPATLFYMGFPASIFTERKSGGEGKRVFACVSRVAGRMNKKKQKNEKDMLRDVVT